MASTYLTRTSSASATKGTLSMWVKKSKVGATQYLHHNVTSTSNNYGLIFFDTNDQIEMMMTTSGSHTIKRVTNRKFRDTSAWYHFVFVTDVTNSTAQNRMRIYVNGVEETSFSTNDSPSGASNRFYEASASNDHVIGANASNSSNFDGSMSHVYNIVDTVYTPSAFGETDSTTGEWKIKTSPSVTFGSQGYLILKDGNTITDQSSNSNDFTLGGGTLTNTEDCPSNNFATLNGLNVGGGISTLSNGNTTYSLSNYSYNTRSTLGMPSGKFYWEQKQSGTNTRIGLITSGFTIDLDTDNANAYYGGSGGGGVYLLMSNTTTSWQYTNNDTSQNTGTYTTAIASGANDILMGAVDVDAGKLWIGVNGVWFNSGNPATGSNATLTFTNSSGDELQIYAGHGTSSARVSSFNFGNGYFATTAITSEGTNASGNGKFEYDVPANFTALSTKGLNL